MTPAQKQSYANKVLHFTPKDFSGSSLKEYLAAKKVTDRLSHVLTRKEIEEMSTKAMSIQERDAMMPLLNNKFCLAEEDSAFVVERKTTKTYCCNCSMFKQNTYICPHIVVVAFQKEDLEGYIDKLYNMANLPFQALTNNLPRQRGKKPGSQKKKRRGQNNIKKGSNHRRQQTKQCKQHIWDPTMSVH